MGREDPKFGPFEERLRDFNVVEFTEWKPSLVSRLLLNHYVEVLQNTFKGEMSLENYLRIRRGVCGAFLDSIERRKDGAPETIEVELLGLLSGYLVKKDVDYIFDSSQDAGYDSQFDAFRQRIINELSIHSPNTGGEDKRVTLHESRRTLTDDINSGLRNVAIFGSFDGAHLGHNALFGDASLVAGRFGRVAAFVSSDGEARLKGIARPLYGQAERIEMLLESKDLDYVIPLPNPKDYGMEIFDFYTRLHSRLPFHFRLIGEKDGNYSLYQRQCAKAGIILVHSGRNRVISTSDIIERGRNV